MTTEVQTKISQETTFAQRIRESLGLSDLK